LFKPVVDYACAVRRMRAVVAAALAWATLALPAMAQDAVDPTVLPEVLDARVTTTEERARLILDLGGATEFAIASLDNPDRIAIDVRASSVKFAAPPDVAGTGMVASYTVEMAASGRARALLVLAGPAQVQQAYVLKAIADQPARLVVDLILDTPEDFAARVAANLAASLAHQGAAQPPPVALAPAPVSPEGQDGIRPLVVIDPGHGGIDNGATAPNGMREKDIVLAFSLQLQEVLVQSGRFDVALTREDDSFLRLEERVALARQNKADLFISIHADTFQQREIQGASVYTRDERATDVLDKVLAENENKRDVVAGFVVPEAQPVVVDILVDLMRRQMRRQSFLAAQAIVRELQPSVSMRRFPVRQADFFVLQAPDVPSLLVELGFLSNPDDVANLQKSEWRDRAVTGLARGIAEYFDGLKDTSVAARP
jgi:N-acetylmuramoyl-L-alanine amidase